MIVASSGNVGKGEVLVKLAKRLTNKIDQAVREGMSLYDFERSMFKEILTIGHAAARVMSSTANCGRVR